MSIKIASPEDIKIYLEGRDPEKYIVSLEIDQTFDWSIDETNKIYVIKDDPEKGKVVKLEKFTPFCWTKSLKDSGFYNDNMDVIRKQSKLHGIYTEKLITDGNDKLEGGFKYLVKTTGTYRQLVNFFKKGGLDPWSRRDLIQILPPTEQFLIQTGKRVFKGYNEYEEIHKLVFDIETTSLEPTSGHMFLIGIKDNRGFRRILDSYDENGLYSEDKEREMIIDFFDIIQELEPSIIIGYNSENFDWSFILTRAEILGLDIKEIAKTKHPLVNIKRQKGKLKLGAELEFYEQTIMWGYNIMDTIHRVRQAMAVNSNIEEGGLKYIAKESKVERPNRVYIDGNLLGKIWVENKKYYYNPTSGQYYLLDGDKPEPKTEESEKGEVTIIKGYLDKWDVVDGRFLITEYLLDDLLETELVDNIYTQAGFLTSSLVPTTFSKSISMGTASMWKLLMMGWSYENGLALPDVSPKRDFVGGLSRLLRLGYSTNIAKFDYASLYPSIQLSNGVFPASDISGAIRALLQYFYDTRNLYKSLMLEAAARGDYKDQSKWDKKQSPIKILNNSSFGSISAPYIFPWGDIDIGEEITCTGRVYLRQMVEFFLGRGYVPLVGDSVTHDTPIYIKHPNGDMDVVSISDIFDENGLINGDPFRDHSTKPFKILTRNGWKDIKYVYRHNTIKKIHSVTTGDKYIKVTEDHSLFKNGVEVKPSDLAIGDNIDVYNIPTNENKGNDISNEKAWLLGFFLGKGSSINNSRCSEWLISDDNTITLNILKKILHDEFGVEAKIKDYTKNKRGFKLKTHKSSVTKWFSENCYTSFREKKVPKEILNSNIYIQRNFLNGFLGLNINDSNPPTNINNKMFQTSQVLMAGISFIFKNQHLGFNIETEIGKFKRISFNEIGGLNEEGSIIKVNRVVKNNNFVYDVSTEDGTFICGIGGIVAHNTDGMNFSTPPEVEERTYIGRGLHRFVKADVEYKGIEADVAEYNERFMFGVMGLDIDDVWPATINLSRKNYATLKPNGKIKLTGNTIKSKSIQKYIKKFLNNGIKLLLHGKGKEFVDYYYEYIEKIYNKEIVLSEIANKGKVKRTVDNYLKRGTDKNGKSLSRQAHMELLIKENIKPDLGDTVFYVNNGTKKSHADIASKKDKETGEEYVTFNCYRIDNEDIVKNPNLKGEYNVPKYLDAFNKKVEPLLVVFNKNVRENLLITNPEDRQYFTNSELELVSGIPNEDKDQDTLEELLTMSEAEIVFWRNRGVDPNTIIKDRFSELELN